MRRRLILVVIALLLALVPLPPHAIERFYSTAVYRWVQPILTTASNQVPFSLLDVLIAGMMLGWAILAVRDISRCSTQRPFRAAGSIAWRSVVWAAALYIAFLVVWGLNYRRVRLQERLPFEPSGAISDDVRRLAIQTVERVNALHQPAHAARWPALDVVDPALAAAFGRASGEIDEGRTVTVARPKTTLLDWYFRRASVDGMTDPYFLETLVSGNLLPFEGAFVVAHEWSHLAGLADEGDANFLGWLTCVHGEPIHRSSGWLFLYQQVAATLSRRDSAELQARLEPGPRADLRAVADRIARTRNPRVSAAGWRVYDQYLKANRVEAGARSYSEVVRLVIGVRFGPDWTPLRRDNK